MILARRRLGLEIGALLAAKLVLLTALYVLFFAQQAPNDPPATAAHVMGSR
jgi:hypothetical protein